jgi:hypothetical protein
MTELDDYRSEREEFDYLAAEIITTENFDREELQTFLALWWAGHILRRTASDHRACLSCGSLRAQWLGVGNAAFAAQEAVQRQVELLRQAYRGCGRRRDRGQGADT